MFACRMCGTEYRHGDTVCRTCGASLHQPFVSKENSLPRAVTARMWMIRGLLGVALVAGVWAFYRYAFREYHPVIALQPDVSAPAPPAGRISSTLITARIEGPFLIVPLHDVVRYRIVRFFDPQGRQDIPILAYVTPSGRLVTAMSLSENCRSTDFFLEGENIHCANCPSYWNASSLEAYACCQKYYPDPIPSTLLGDELRIESAHIRAWQPRS